MLFSFNNLAEYKTLSIGRGWLVKDELGEGNNLALRRNQRIRHISRESEVGGRSKREEKDCVFEITVRTRIFGIKGLTGLNALKIRIIC